jgi:hypothetical protein
MRRQMPVYNSWLVYSSWMRAAIMYTTRLMMSTFCCSRRRRRRRLINNLCILLVIASSRSGLKIRCVYLRFSSTAAIYKVYVKSGVRVIFDAAVLLGTVSLCRYLFVGGYFSSSSAGGTNGCLRVKIVGLQANPPCVIISRLELPIT